MITLFCPIWRSKPAHSDPGYKLRCHIAKALQRCSEAIRNALKRYNAQAEKLNPPRAQLSWDEVVDYSFLAEFDILHFVCSMTQNQPWTKPAYHEATVKHSSYAVLEKK